MNLRRFLLFEPPGLSLYLSRSEELQSPSHRYYWKDSSLDNRYCSWYSCDLFYSRIKFLIKKEK
ncbi:30S ribosomal protein s8 chloroplastic [Phtheirospermum japonicum]|uniref:30S ribosomal protein s8 chloroplastic n=1 Tax=Phtheirospermum japonicum TaxID=374723 RepID=A0A830CBP1_9LAMI|nr:30S ribosomal protein s8 chloroplastic [Phtheirospermum japonicum]